ncbi:MAG: hypothetical protein ACREQO_08365 [Candidatus Binatia bacterium]
MPKKLGYDGIAEVSNRYLKGGALPDPVESWLWNHPTSRIKKGHKLRICLGSPFRLRWTADGWATLLDTDSRPTSIGAEYVDIAISSDKHTRLEFTFFWTQVEEWEERNFQVTLQ